VGAQVVSCLIKLLGKGHRGGKGASKTLEGGGRKTTGGGRVGI